MTNILNSIKQKLTAQLRRRWQKIKAIPPGKRFQERYYRRQNKREQRSQLKKIVLMLFGVAIILFGMFLWFVPGPGWLTIFVGAAIIAGESLIIARLLDWLEVKLRKVFKKKPDSDNLELD